MKELTKAEEQVMQELWTLEKAFVHITLFLPSSEFWKGKVLSTITRMGRRTSIFR